MYVFFEYYLRILIFGCIVEKEQKIKNNELHLHYKNFIKLSLKAIKVYFFKF
jgi:hypothetical protein